MFNNLLEAWVDSLLPYGFAGFIGERRFGMPTVHLEADFKAVSRMGDDVILHLEVIHIGSRSLKLALNCTSLEGELRMQVTQTLVTTSLKPIVLSISRRSCWPRCNHQERVYEHCVYRRRSGGALLCPTDEAAKPCQQHRGGERNRPYDTFGWGVVFSDATLENLRQADPVSAEQIARQFNRWDDIEIHFGIR
jgi:4-hydroxybenzoyl-CoA thioesterase